MKKLVTLASVGVFLLSLQGVYPGSGKGPGARSGSPAGCASSHGSGRGNAGGP